MDGLRVDSRARLVATEPAQEQARSACPQLIQDAVTDEGQRSHPYSLCGKHVEFYRSQKASIQLSPRTYVLYLSSSSWRNALLSCEFSLTLTSNMHARTGDYVSIGNLCRLEQFLKDFSAQDEQLSMSLECDYRVFEVKFVKDLDKMETRIVGCIPTREWLDFQSEINPEFSRLNVRAQLVFDYVVPEDKTRQIQAQLADLLTHLEDLYHKHDAPAKIEASRVQVDE